MQKICSLFSLLIFTFQFSFSQEIKVTGNITDTLHHPLTFNIIANKTTGSAAVYMNGAAFALKAKPTDTLVFSSRGYGMLKFAVHDSMKNGEAVFHIKLKPLHENLKDVVIVGTKNPDAIRKEINELHKTDPDIYKEVNPLQSPITALYEAFNKNEKAKRKVAEMEYHDRKKKILKETCHLLMVYDVITLNENELNNFVDYLDLSEEFMKESSNYELGVAIKSQYLKFKTYQH